MGNIPSTRSLEEAAIRKDIGNLNGVYLVSRTDVDVADTDNFRRSEVEILEIVKSGSIWSAL